MGRNIKWASDSVKERGRIEGERGEGEGGGERGGERGEREGEGEGEGGERDRGYFNANASVSQNHGISYYIKHKKAS